MAFYTIRPAPQPPASKQWLARRFPHRQALIADLRERIQRTPDPITAYAPEPGHFGLALERTIALDLCDSPPYPELFASLPEPACRTLLATAGYQPVPGSEPLWRRTGGLVTAARLFTVGSVLTDLDHIAARAHGVIAPTDTQRRLRAPLRHRETFINCATRIRAARPTFASFWASYRIGFRTALLSYGPVIAAPPLLDGLRVADLIAGTTIIELKTGHLTDTHQFRDLIDQILTYALLAPLSGYPITAAVVYLARYNVLARYPIDTLTIELAGEPMDTTEAGRHLGMLIQTEQHPRAAA